MYNMIIQIIQPLTIIKFQAYVMMKAWEDLVLRVKIVSVMVMLLTIK